MLGAKTVELEFDNHQPSQFALVEEQVHVEVFAVECDALLSCQEGEAASQFHDEAFHLAQDGRFEVFLLVGVFEPEEVEQVRVTQHHVGGKAVFVTQCGQFEACQFGRLARERGALVAHAADLVPQRTHAPSFGPAHLSVELALQGRFQRQQRQEVRPAQFSQQRYDNPLVRKDLGELDHAAQVFLAKARAVFEAQLS